MNTMITIRTDADLKNQAQNLAERLGISISAIVNNSLREFVLNKKVVFAEPLTLNIATRKRLDKIIKEIDKGKNLSKSFYTAKDAIAHLKSL